MDTTSKILVDLIEADGVLEENPTKAIELAKAILHYEPNQSALLVCFLGQVKLGYSEIDLEPIRSALETSKLDLEHRRVECHLALGRAYRKQGLLELALGQFRCAYEAASRSQNGRQMAEALNLTASALAGSGEQQQAIAYLHQALQIDQTQPLGVYKANILINLSGVFRKLGKMQLAIEYVRQAYFIFEQFEERLGFINALLSLAQLHNELGNFDQARLEAQKALEEAVKVKNTQFEIAVLNTQAYIELSSQEWLAAQSLFLAALTKAQAGEYKFFEIDNLDGLGQVYTALGRFEEALAVHQEAHVIALQAKHSEGQLDALLNLGRDYLALSQPENALQVLCAGLELAQQLERRRSVFEAHQLISTAYKTLGNLALALEHHEYFYRFEREFEHEINEEKTRTLMVQFDVERVQQENRIAQEARLIAEKEVLQRTAELKQTQIEVLQRLALAAEYRDDQTGQHTLRVGQLSALVARKLGWLEPEVELLAQAARLHDIGKIGIPDVILNKPGKYNTEEFEIMKTHTSIGAKILSGGDSRLMQMAELIAYSHHEHFDGNGYPNGLSGQDIPLAARIVAVADVYDALISERNYKPAWSVRKALDEVIKLSDSHFDPQVVAAFVAIQTEL
jgi:putative nucleotidyltransferase with HDIG domain